MIHIPVNNQGVSIFYHISYSSLKQDAPGVVNDLTCLVRSLSIPIVILFTPSLLIGYLAGLSNDLIILGQIIIALLAVLICCAFLVAWMCLAMIGSDIECVESVLSKI